MYNSDLDYSSESIINRAKEGLKNPPNKIEGSFAMDVVQATAMELANEHIHVDFHKDMGFLDSAVGEYLDLIIPDYVRDGSIKRKQATCSTGIVTFTGVEDAFVPIGTLVSSDTLQYQTIEAGTIIDGTLDLKCQCLTPGTEGNIPVGTITNLDTNIQGIGEVTNKENIVNGTDVEDDETLRSRVYLRIRKPPTSGNKYHYLHWALSVEGVGRARVFPLWNGPGTVKVSILNSNTELPDKDLINKVVSFIDPSPGMGEGQAPIGATLTASSPNTVNIDIDLNIKLYEQYDLEETKQAIEGAIKGYFKSISYLEDGEIENVSYTKIINILWDVEGIEDILDIKLNGNQSNIMVGLEEIPTLGKVVITE